MHIDLFTFAAQIFNFLLLVFLVKKFLFDRLKQAMEKRKETILQAAKVNEKLAQELQLKAAALEEKERFLRENEAQMMKQAAQAAENYKEELMRSAKTEADSVKAVWLKSARDELSEFKEEILRLMIKLSAQTAQKAIKDLTETDIRTVLLRLLLNRINSETEAAKAFIAELKRTGEIELITDSTADAKIAAELKSLFDALAGRGIKLTENTDPLLVLGAELRCGGARLSWNISQYLDDFSDQLRSRLQNGG